MAEEQQLELIEAPKAEEATEAPKEVEPVEVKAEEPKEVAPPKEVEAIEELPAEAPKDDGQAQAQADTTKLKATNKTLSKENTRLQGVIKGVLDGLTSALPKEDLELLTELAGDRPDKQLEIYNRLKAAGKIGTTTQQKQIPEADRTRVAIGDGEAKRPDTWKEADRKMARRLKQVR